MSVATATYEAMSAKGLKQERLAGELHLARSTVSMILIGQRLVPTAVAPVLARKLDHPRLYMELALAATGGAGPVWFDGPGMDEHCLCRAEDAVIEMAEAIAVMERSRVALVSGGMSEVQAVRFEDELADATDRLLNALGRHCLKAGRSYGAVWDRQRAHNEARGYVRQEARRVAQRAS